MGRNEGITCSADLPCRQAVKNPPDHPAWHSLQLQSVCGASRRADSGLSASSYRQALLCWVQLFQRSGCMHHFHHLQSVLSVCAAQRVEHLSSVHSGACNSHTEQCLLLQVTMLVHAESGTPFWSHKGAEEQPLSLSLPTHHPQAHKGHLQLFVVWRGCSLQP